MPRANKTPYQAICTGIVIPNISSLVLTKYGELIGYEITLITHFNYSANAKKEQQADYYRYDLIFLS